MKEIYIDDLTGCYNRRFLYYWIENEIKRATRFGTKFTLILLDMDDFRDINNNFGHSEGDKVLIEFSSFLQTNIREVDNLVRYGGDEFLILMPNTDEKGAIELAQRILNNLNEIKILGYQICCSIGFSVFPDDGTIAETLINQADSLMYQAKKQGKSRIGLKQEIVKKLQIPSPITIGRDDESNWCLGQLKNYNTIFIAGEAGIGKTRLAFEIKERLKTPILLKGNAYAALSSVPYHPFKNMFNELINKDFDLIERVFKQMPEIYQSEIKKILPAEHMVRIPQTEGLDKYRLYNSVSEFMSKISEIFSPDVTILLIDDLHWADRPSCELFDFLIRSIKDNIRILGTYRVEEIKDSPLSDFWGIWAREKLYTQLTLLPLNKTQSNQLLEKIMGTIPSSAANFIYHESGGNPFYLEEILRELERQQKIYWNGREWVFAKSLNVMIPSSIEETIKRKLKFLEPEIKKYLEIAAVFGQEFNAATIATASKRNVGQILDAIDELCRLGFIKENTPDNFFFSEDVVLQIVYKNILKGDLIQYHKGMGETIEIMYRDVLLNYFEQLATHFTIANDSLKALYYSKKAALKAKDNYAHTIALKFFENALKYEDDIEEIFKIKFSLAEIYFLIGDYKKARQQLNTCLKINPNSYKVCEKLGNVYENMGDYKNSLKYYQTGLKMTQGTEASYTFRTALSWLYARLGQYSRAKKECENMLKKKRQMSRQAIGDTYVVLGILHLQLGKFKKAESYFKKGLKIRETIGDKKRIAACYLDLGLNYHQKFKFKLGEKFYNKALNIYEEIGYQDGILTTFNNIGALYASYDFPKAEEYYLLALKQAKLIGAKENIVFLCRNLGEINYNRMMDDQAFMNYKQAMKYSRQLNFHEGIIFSNLGISEFYREKGKIKKGKSYLEKALRVAGKINLRYPNIDCLMEEIEYLLVLRKLKKADILSKKLLSQLRMERDVEYKIYSLIHRAKVLVELKKYTKAHFYYNKAYNYIKSLSRNKISGEIYFLRGVVYKKEKRFKDALKLFLEANRIFKAIGHLRYLSKIEQEMEEIST